MAQQTPEQMSKSPEAKVQKKVRGQYHDDDISKYAVTIGKPTEEVFSFFRNFDNLPFFMKDLKEVTVLDKKRSHWVVEIEAGPQVEWDAEITKERPGEMFSWKSVEGSDIETSGSVWFSPAPQGLGTVVSLAMDYKIPGGKATEILAKLSGEDPDSLALINLRRLKAYLETGEIPTTKGQPSGRKEDVQDIDQPKTQH